jgi:hypothetical protein
MAKKKIAPDYPAFPGHGVLTRDDDSSYAEAVRHATSTEEGLEVQHPRLSSVTYPTDNLTIDQKTGRLSFISSATPYGIRELREDDGAWLSKYKTLLPISALNGLIGYDSGEDVANPEDDLTQPDESLDAFATDTSPYVVGVVYTNNAGRWSREGGDWVLLSPTDTTFDADEDTDLTVITIDPDRADDFLRSYDQNYVSVNDAEKFEDDNRSGAAMFDSQDTDQ